MSGFTSSSTCSGTATISAPRRVVASATVSTAPARAPVCEDTARAPLVERPAFSNTHGLRRAAARTASKQPTPVLDALDVPYDHASLRIIGEGGRRRSPCRPPGFRGSRTAKSRGPAPATSREWPCTALPSGRRGRSARRRRFPARNQRSRRSRGADPAERVRPDQSEQLSGSQARSFASRPARACRPHESPPSSTTAARPRLRSRAVHRRDAPGKPARAETRERAAADVGRVGARPRRRLRTARRARQGSGSQGLQHVS